jgi:hypothetical protein
LTNANASGVRTFLWVLSSCVFFCPVLLFNSEANYLLVLADDRAVKVGYAPTTQANATECDPTSLTRASTVNINTLRGQNNGTSVESVKVGTELENLDPVHTSQGKEESRGTHLKRKPPPKLCSIIIVAGTPSDASYFPRTPKNGKWQSAQLSGSGYCSN